MAVSAIGFQPVEKGPAYAGLFVIYMVKYMW